MKSPDSVDDLQLLRQYEPILCFTQGEMFFPMDVEPYLSRSSLWMTSAAGEDKLLVDEGRLDGKTIADLGDVPTGCAVYMRFVNQPFNAIELQRWMWSSPRPKFRAPSRLSRVGIGARLADAVFSLSLLLRGTVPGETAAKATQMFLNIHETDPERVYYGRVMRVAGYIVLQYLFFYPMNDWRSSFHGANDHEGDWEQMFVFLDENRGGEPFPVWVACAAHDAFGDDLRRRWDDPDLTFIDGHPVVFIGAGSHATYFVRGEYLTPVELRFMRPVTNVVGALERVWRNTLRQGSPDQTTQRLADVMKVAFVDYARGDGLIIGPGQFESWTPHLLTENVDWAERYRGLWGLDTRDRFGGERAPAGPKFNRDGTVRLSWHNPLGWSGLEKVAPPSQSQNALVNRLESLRTERCEVDSRIAELQGTIPALELEVRALQQGEHLVSLLTERQRVLGQQVADLNDLYRERAQLDDTMAACSSYLRQFERGSYGDPKAHIRHELLPQQEPELRRGVIAEIWAAISVGLLLLAILAEVLFGFVGGLIVGLSVAVGIFVVIEAMFHRRVEQLLLNITIILAVVSSVVLVYEFWLYIILVLVAAIAVVIITDNLRELLRR